ncbi:MULTISPECIES: NAD(P)H-hydrate epimerase [Halorubrum]|uniref:NAD(P)H-hydrate epimerase n=1 Tax=Halorubrum TaxID=56688 RepID=UPI0015D47903|nr:NAD(P)H-hydrate epimerase [Halorubrum persicum]
MPSRDSSHAAAGWRALGIRRIGASPFRSFSTGLGPTSTASPRNSSGYWKRWTCRSNRSTATPTSTPTRRWGGVVVDALIGYGLAGTPRGSTAELIEAVCGAAKTVVSLDVPSGTNATTGETPGVAVEPDCTVTLALPKTGLRAVGGDLLLADLSIPSTVYDRLDVEYAHPFVDRFAVPLSR